MDTRTSVVELTIGPLVLAGCVYAKSGCNSNAACNSLPAQASSVAYTQRSDMDLKNSIRRTPLRVGGNGLWRHVVAREHIMCAMAGSAPVWTPPPEPNLIHTVQLFGISADFSFLAEGWTGEQMVAVLLNDKLCRTRTARVGGSYIVDSPYGAHVVLVGTYDALGLRSEAHHGQLIKALAQAGVPSDSPTTTSSGTTLPLVYLIHDSIMRFDWGTELDFFGVALPMYLEGSAWVNRLGTEFTYNELIARLISRPLGTGSCAGCHAPYAVAFILRIDRDQNILGEVPRQKAVDYLAALSRLYHACCRRRSFPMVRGTRLGRDGPLRVGIPTTC